MHTAQEVLATYVVTPGTSQMKKRSSLQVSLEMLCECRRSLGLQELWRIFKVFDEPKVDETKKVVKEKKLTTRTSG
jgi:hypothetical protein